MSRGFGPLVSTEWLAEHLDHEPLRVVDTRWYLTEPGRGRSEYEAGHVPGAGFMSIDTDLSAAHGPGRHPLPGPNAIAHRLGTLGIGDANSVVAYDDAGGGIAARLWWMLRSIGHQRVGVLDGGIQAWVAAGGTESTAQPDWPPGKLTVLGGSQTIDRDSLRGRLGEVTILDARAAERYRGDTEPVDAAAGHIPTAVNLPHSGNLDADGRFLAPAALRARYEGAGVADAASTVVYCGSGVTACHDILAMGGRRHRHCDAVPGKLERLVGHGWQRHGGKRAGSGTPGLERVVSALGQSQSGLGAVERLSAVEDRSGRGLRTCAACPRSSRW